MAMAMTMMVAMKMTTINGVDDDDDDKDDGDDVTLKASCPAHVN